MTFTLVANGPHDIPDSVKFSGPDVPDAAAEAIITNLLPLVERLTDLERFVAVDCLFLVLKAHTYGRVVADSRDGKFAEVIHRRLVWDKLCRAGLVSMKREFYYPAAQWAYSPTEKLLAIAAGDELGVKR